MTRPFASALGPAFGAARAGCLAAVVAFTALGCSSEPMQKQPALPHLDAEEDWKHSILWLHATDGAPASKEGQCTHVANVIDKEQRCQGTFCAHGAKLAGEWLTKCAKILGDRQQAISDLQATFEDRAEARQSVCARQYARLMDGCGGQEDCVQRARSWATRCGETEATPLTVAMLEEVLGRTASEEGVTEIKLDARSCKSLGEPLRKGALCADMATCLEAWKQVESYRKRCHTEEQKPPATVAALELAIALGAG